MIGMAQDFKNLMFSPWVLDKSRLSLLLIARFSVRSRGELVISGRSFSFQFCKVRLDVKTLITKA